MHERCASRPATAVQWTDVDCCNWKVKAWAWIDKARLSNVRERDGKVCGERAMIYERLIGAFESGDDGMRWRSFARAVIAEIRSAGTSSSDAMELVERATQTWDRAADEQDLLVLKADVWRFLTAKNGDTTSIRDADDRALRALLTVLDPNGDRAKVEDAAEWVETVLTGFGA